MSEKKRNYKYECPYCGRKFISKYNLEGHIRTKHKNEEVKKEEIKKEEKRENVKKTGEPEKKGGVKMEEKDIRKIVNETVAGIKESVSQLNKKVEQTSSSVDKIINSLPKVIAQTLQTIEEEKKRQEEERRKQMEWERKMRDLEEILKHKEDIINFCKKNPQLCRVEIDKILPKEKEHLPHKTVAEVLACPECGPRILKGIGKKLAEDGEFAKKFAESLKETGAKDRLKELIELGKKVQEEVEGERETGKPKETGESKEGKEEGKPEEGKSKEGTKTTSTGLF